VIAKVEHRDYGCSGAFLLHCTFREPMARDDRSTGETWNNLQTGQFDLVGRLHMAFILLPVAVVILRCGPERQGRIARRVVQSKYGDWQYVSFAVLGLLAIAAAA